MDADSIGDLVEYTRIQHCGSKIVLGRQKNGAVALIAV